jgi:RHS repeat-associated protein
LAQDKGNGAVLWGLADNQGSIRLVTDNNGNVVNEITYDAFGNVVLESNGNVEFRFGYTGRELDEETGDYYYRSRYYDSTIGRFVNEDTIGFEGGDANLYRYVSNSPTNYTDPSGNFRLSLGPPPVTSPSPVTPPPGVGVGVGVGVGTGAAAGTEAGLGAAIGGGLLLAAATVGFWLLTTESVADATLGQDDNTESEPDPENTCRAVYLDEDDEKKQYVFRGDSRPPQEIFSEGGFWPWNSNGTISLREHVTLIRDNPKEDLSDLVVDEKTESQWISTSNNEQHAATYSEILDRRGNVVDYGYVYKIRRPPNGRDVYLEIGNGEPNRKEIAFEGGFSRQYIESYRKVEGQKKSGEYILGPSKPFPR